MNKIAKDCLLHAVRLPARVNAEEAAVLLGFESHDIPTLIARGLLKPLGSPGRNSPKRFSSADILAKSDDLKWLCRAEVVVADKWKLKNSRRSQANPKQEVWP